MTIDWDKPIQTVDGEPARMVCRDREGSDGCPHVVLIKRISTAGTPFERASFVDAEGREHGGRQVILNVPDKEERWLNIYRNSLGINTFATREAADKSHRQNPSSQRIAVVRLSIDSNGQVETEVIPV